MASPLLEALNKTLRSTGPKTLYGRTNMIGKVVSYDEAAKSIKVEAMNGPMAGEIMDIAFPSNHKNKIQDFIKPSKAQTSPCTPIGGFLRFDGVAKNRDGQGYTTSWINSWIKNPGDDNRLTADAQTQLIDTNTETASGFPHMRLAKMEPALERRVGSLDELQEALADAFESHKGALLIDIADGVFNSIPATLRGKKEGENFVYPEPKEAAADIIGKLNDDMKAAFVEALADRGMVVVPMVSMSVGGKTAEEIKDKLKKAAEAGTEARVMSINPLAYEVPSIGLRLDNALVRTDRDGKTLIAKEHAERLGTAFLKTAADEAKAAFHKDGWRGVADVDLQAFFASAGVALTEHPKSAWNRAAIHEQRFEGGDDFFAAKTHESARYGNPYPALECTRDLRSAYSNELVNAVKAVMTAPVVKTEVAAEAKAAEPKVADAKASEAPAAAAAATEAEVPAADAAEASASDIANVDDLLRDVMG